MNSPLDIDEILSLIILKFTENDMYYYLKYQFYNLRKCMFVCKTWISLSHNLGKTIMSMPPKEFTLFRPNTQELQYMGILQSSSPYFLRYVAQFGMYIPQSVFDLPDQYFANYNRMIMACNVFKKCPEKSIPNYTNMRRKYIEGNGGNDKFFLPHTCLCNICLKNTA